MVLTDVAIRLTALPRGLDLIIGLFVNLRPKSEKDLKDFSQFERTSDDSVKNVGLKINGLCVGVFWNQHRGEVIPLIAEEEPPDPTSTAVIDDGLHRQGRRVGQLLREAALELPGSGAGQTGVKMAKERSPPPSDRSPESGRGRSGYRQRPADLRLPLRPGR